LASNLHKIDNISFKEAALVEPLASCIYGLSSIKVNYGDKALIFEAGPIGLIILQLFKISGASRITMVDVDKKKEKIVEAFSASEMLLNNEKLDKNLKSISKYGFDIVIDTTGKSQVCEQLFRYVNNKARILFYGVCGKNKKINISSCQI
jgi:threonine dehydrogenase-like Zn-dependent dehydrogenase